MRDFFVFCTKAHCAAFLELHFGFVIFWHKNIGAKGRRKMLMKLTPKENIEEVLLKVTAKNIFHFILDLVNSIFLLISLFF
jgi:hypothetical protein